MQGVDRDSYQATIARKIFELAKDLGVSVVAEGFKDEEQWRWVLAQYADYAQGCFFASPATPRPLARSRIVSRETSSLILRTRIVPRRTTR
jgi:EAL domain-containing protein (putative c-di-GMP-specific phosphodiesterase class I)